MLLLAKQRNFKSSLRPCLRTMGGSGIVEGLVGLMLIIGSTILAVILLLNTGIATYNKEKVAFVADQAATYATSLTNLSTRDADVRSFVNSLLNQMGVKASNTTVKVTDIACSKWAAVSVSVSTTLPTLMSSGFSFLIPQQLQVSDTAVAIKSPYATAYCVGVAPVGGQVTLALLNATGVLPNDSLPAWSINLDLGVLRLR